MPTLWFRFPTAPLVQQYQTPSGRGRASPVLAVFTKNPPPCSTKYGIMFCALVDLADIDSKDSFILLLCEFNRGLISYDMQGFTLRIIIPALLTTMSSFPN